MRYEESGEARTVVLSRRNVFTLLSKLDGHPPWSNITIRGGEESRGIQVRAEENDVHYGSREAARQHSETEDDMDEFIHIVLTREDAEAYVADLARASNWCALDDTDLTRQGIASDLNTIHEIFTNALDQPETG